MVIGFEVQMCSEEKKEEENELRNWEKKRKKYQKEAESVNFEEILRGWHRIWNVIDIAGLDDDSFPGCYPGGE